MSWLDEKYIDMKLRTRRFVDEFKSDEHGVANFVATILMIVVVVALVALFWDKISEWFNDTWDSIMSDSEPIGNTGSGGE